MYNEKSLHVMLQFFYLVPYSQGSTCCLFHVIVHNSNLLSASIKSACADFG